MNQFSKDTYILHESHTNSSLITLQFQTYRLVLNLMLKKNAVSA